MGRRRKPLTGDTVASVLLDASAVLAYAKDQPEVRGWVLRAERAGIAALVSWVTIAEVYRDAPGGSREHWVLSRLTPEQLTLRDCYEAGTLMGRTRSGGKTVDALLAATALRLPPPVAVLTSDETDLRQLLEDRPRVQVVRV